MHRTLVWDAPIRVVHWSIAFLIVIAWLTRDARRLDLHAAAGYCALALCAFRIVWGFIGTRHAKFRDFAYSPSSALRYLRDMAGGRAGHYLGHNPAGSWSIYLLLTLELLVGISGVFAIAGMHGLGPLAGFVSHRAADVAITSHKMAAWSLVALIGIHLAGVAASYRTEGLALVRAMISGAKATDAPLGPQPAHRGLAFAILTITLVIGMGYLAVSRDTRAAQGTTATARAEVTAITLDPTWQRECESCHLPYAPCMLPERSWTAMMENRADHFGEDLALSEAARAELQRVILVTPPSESWACWKTRNSVPANATPLRIIESPYWKTAHEDLPRSAFQAPISSGGHDCGACHRDAASSIFHPRMIHYPR